MCAYALQRHPRRRQNLPSMYRIASPVARGRCAECRRPRARWISLRGYHSACESMICRWQHAVRILPIPIIRVVALRLDAACMAADHRRQTGARADDEPLERQRYHLQQLIQRSDIERQYLETTGNRNRTDGIDWSTPPAGADFPLLRGPDGKPARARVS